MKVKCQILKPEPRTLVPKYRKAEMKSMNSNSRIWLFALMAVAASTAQLQAADLVANSSTNVIRHPQIGVCTHFVFPGWEPDKVVPILAASGVSWIRDDINWARIEKEKGVYEISERDWKWINAVHDAGINIIAIFNYGNKIYAPDNYNPEAYAKAAAWFAKETAGKIQVIEVLNEPGNFGFNTHYGSTSWNGIEADGSVSTWVRKYVELLNIAAPAIKAANPKVKVIGLGAPPPTNFRELEMGISPLVDGLVDHPYSPRTSDENVPYSSSPGILKRDGIATADEKGTFASQIRMYREWSAKFNGPKEIWLTEFGWPTHQEAKAGGLFAGFTRDAQAKYILRRLTEALGLGVSTAMIYDIKDDGPDPYYNEQNFGLVDVNLKPKPAYGAVKRYCAAMATCTPKDNVEVNIFAVENRPDQHPIVWDGSKLGASGRIKNYQFTNGQGKPVVVVWSSQRAGGDLNPILADIECITDKPIASIQAYNPMTDETYAVKYEKKEGRVLLKKVSVPDCPLILTLE